MGKEDNVPSGQDVNSACDLLCSYHILRKDRTTIRMKLAPNLRCGRSFSSKNEAVLRSVIVSVVSCISKLYLWIVYDKECSYSGAAVNVILSHSTLISPDYMANIIRSPKSGNDWGLYEMSAYNINVADQLPEEFFHRNPESPDFKLLGIDPLLIDSDIDAEDSDVPDNMAFQYLTHLDLAMTHLESFITDVARETLRILGFAERDLALSTHFMIPLTICGDVQFTRTDVCLLNRQTMILLILQEEVTAYECTWEPQEQVIASAIAAYQHNNKQRQSRGLPTLDAMTIPCITMVDMEPTFYLVPVTQELSDAVATGQYPQTPTRVVDCIITLGPNDREGLQAPQYRRRAFQYLVTFRELAKEYWQTFLV